MRDGAAPPATDDEAFWAFYSQSIALITFLFDAGGRAALLELAYRLRDGYLEPRAAVTGLPGLAQDFEEVEAAWEAWLKGGR